MSSPSVRSTLPAAFLLSIIGSYGLVYILDNTLPTLGPRWLFFFFSLMAVTGIFLPIITFLNIRFPTQPQATRKVVVREASILGIFFSTLAWLQLGRALSFGVGFLIAVGLIVIEFLIRMREKSRWQP